MREERLIGTVSVQFTARSKFRTQRMYVHLGAAHSVGVVEAGFWHTLYPDGRVGPQGSPARWRDAVLHRPDIETMYSLQFADYRSFMVCETFAEAAKRVLGVEHDTDT